MEFNYCLNPDDDKPILLINTHIGITKGEDGKELKGVIGADFLRELQELEQRGKKECEIWFNTGGGSVKDGWDIYGGIRLSKMRVTGLNIGIAASTGGWCFEACHYRIMMDYSLLMMHNPHGGSEQGQQEFTESIAVMLSARANKTKEETLVLMNATTFMNAEEALANGFCDEIRSSGTNVKNAAPNVDTIWNKGNEFFNNILLPGLKPKTEKTMPENKHKGIIDLINSFDDKAKLPENADTKTILSAAKKIKTIPVDKMVNAGEFLGLLINLMNDWEEDHKNLEKERDDAKAAMDAANASNDDEDAMKDMQDKYDAMCDRLKKMEDDHKSEMEERENADCQNAIGDAIRIGKISNSVEAKTFFTETGKTLGAKKLKEMFNTMPVNKAQPFATPKDFEKVDGESRGTDAPATTVAEWKDKFKNEFGSVMG